MGLVLCDGAVAQEYLSPCDADLSADAKILYVTGKTGRKIVCFDTEKRKVVREISLEMVPSGLIQSKDGESLFVVVGGFYGHVLKLDASTGEEQQRIEVGHTPVSPVLSPDGRTLYVCNRFDNNVSFIDLETGETTAKVAVLREPIAADLSRDGRYLFVGNHIPDGRADVDYVASKVSVIDTETQEVKTIPLVNGAEGIRGLKISSDGKHVFVTHLMARFLVPTTQLERGWVSTDALSVIQVSDRTLKHTVLLDDVDQGFANPWAIGFSADGKTLVVSSAGNHEISLIDLPEMICKVEAEAAPSNSAYLDAHNNLSFLAGIRKRVKLNGNGPRALAVVGQTACVANYFTDSLDVVNFSNPDNVVIKSFPLGPKLPMTDERLGETFFNDASLCFQNWLSCATCHPDARTDGLNWDLLNDGMGNPKNVKTMLLSHKTPQAMWLGVRADAETGVRAGLRHIQFIVRPDEDAQKIDAYLKSLEPVPSPRLDRETGGLTEAAIRGKRIFEQSGCAHCHPAPLFTDLEMRDVGTTKGQDTGKPVDTPHLVEVWRTAPYLHDGRAATLHDVVTSEDHARILNATSGMSEQEINDLVEYLGSL